MLVAVAEVVLAELAGGVALLLHRVAEGRRPVGDAVLGAGHADGQQAGAERMLAEGEGGTAGGAGLLAVGVGEQRAFPGDAVDVGRLVAHHALVVGAEIEVADIVAKDHQDVRFVRRLHTQCEAQQRNGAQQLPYSGHVEISSSGRGGGRRATTICASCHTVIGRRPASPPR
ncbi:hypothetical protein D9M69_564550 [compost metagenome]